MNAVIDSDGMSMTDSAAASSSAATAVHREGYTYGDVLEFGTTDAWHSSHVFRHLPLPDMFLTEMCITNTQYYDHRTLLLVHCQKYMH